MYTDKSLNCRDCEKPFVFTARDQEFYAQKGFTNPPTRCKDCRLRKKTADQAAANRTLFKITCKVCGKVGEMATEPRKPDDVMCSECFYAEFEKQIAKEQGQTTPPEPVFADQPADTTPAA
jgi:hypothetical protein